MRLVTALCCTVVLALVLVPGVRADEYTKETFLTFSGPVQLPGASLPAGTYQIRLADPSGDRRLIQVWDKEHTKLYTTVMTIPNLRGDTPNDPVVMFTETPAGEPQAIKAWWYPGERYGMEFIYPKDQALKIAKAVHAPVLSVSDDKVGRLAESGSVVEESASTSSSSTTTASTTSTTTESTREVVARAPESTSTTTASASTTTAPRAAAQSASTATAPPANRSEPPAPVGTAGNAPAPAPQAAAAQTAPAPATSAPAPRTLPRTGSALALIELLSGLSLFGAVGVRQLRKRMTS